MLHTSGGHQDPSTIPGVAVEPKGCVWRIEQQTLSKRTRLCEGQRSARQGGAFVQPGHSTSRTGSSVQGKDAEQRHEGAQREKTKTEPARRREAHAKRPTPESGHPQVVSTANEHPQGHTQQEDVTRPHQGQRAQRGKITSRRILTRVSRATTSRSGERRRQQGILRCRPRAWDFPLVACPGKAQGASLEDS